MKVLVVDDSRADRNIIRYNFESHGCQVLEACNGRQGIELALAERPDLVISDILMPIMDGFQFLRELKKLPDLQSLTFIFYSAVYTGNQEAELALSLGANAFLEKPKSPDELWKEVGAALSAAGSAIAGIAPPDLVHEEEFLRNYCQVVAGRLEEKVRELSGNNENLLKLNAELEQRLGDRTAQLDAANRELEEFSYSVSHDLRAPLRHIDGFSQALADDHAATLDTMGKEYLDRVRKSTKKMIEMMDAILELSRNARGAMNMESVDLTALAKEVAAEMERSQPERKVRFEITDGMVARGDARLLKVVLQHLLGNAWKFTAPIEEPVIQFYPTEWDGSAAFAVTDNGVGFDASYTDKLFSPFQRLHTQQEFPGLGVGLAMARRIISRHGGKIRAQSETGKGATIIFTL